jgi:MSHA biogenesis protein MshI
MFGWFKKSVSGALGLEVSPFGVAIAHLSDDSEDGLTKADCGHFEGSLEHCAADLERWINDRSLQQMDLQIVLHPSLYTLYFVDRPDVDDADLAEAVRWKVKDLVETPLKDLVIDAFAVPDDAYRGVQKKVYVVAVQREVLEEQISILKKLSVEIQGVSISELADRAILKVINDDQAGSALLRLRSATGTINLTDGGDLYLTRNIDSSVLALESATDQNRNQVLDNLLLEVQRCVDFYDSQLGKGSIRKMLVAPTRFGSNLLDDYLQDHLGMSVHPLDLNDNFSFAEPISAEMQSLCFAAVAAATEHRGVSI